MLRGVSITALVARRRHGRVDVDASFFQFLDVVEFDVAAIGQMLARTFAVVLRQSRIHRRHLSHVGAAVVDGDAGDRAAARIGGELHIVGRSKAAIGHLHHPCLGVRGRGARLLLFLFFVLRFRLLLLRCRRHRFARLVGVRPL